MVAYTVNTTTRAVMLRVLTIIALMYVAPLPLTSKTVFNLQISRATDMSECREIALDS